MKLYHRLLALLLCGAMTVSFLPAASAVQGSDSYTITNDYISYTLNTKTGGFSVETLEGHPQKQYDNYIPLLYQSDEASTCTSYVTVRIDGKDYVFGQDYNWLGVNTAPLSVPRIENEGQTMITDWSVDGYTITQKVGVTRDENNDRTGNVGFSFEVVNNNGKPGQVGIRVLMDAALGNAADAPYLLADDDAIPYLTETEFQGEDVPDQIRGVDSLAGATSMCYAMLKGWDDGAAPDRVVLGHWANLANTRYDYAPNPSCDFSNYSNQYRTPDSAMAFYWTEALLEAHTSRKAQFLYGVGNFSGEREDAAVGLGLTTSTIRVNDEKTGYVASEEDGHFTLTATVDNSVDGAKDLYGVTITPTLDKGLSLVGEELNGARALEELKKGEVRTYTWKVKADQPSMEITALQCRVAVTATAVQGAPDTARDVNVEAGRYVILPAANGALPDVSFSSLLPDIVYYGEGDDKSLTLSGELSGFSALAGKSGWDLYLVKARKAGETEKTEIAVKKENIAFFGEKNDTLSFSTTQELPLGTYEVVFRFNDSELVKAFGRELTTDQKVISSDDTRYRGRSYGIIALVRYAGTRYRFVPFSSEAALEDFRAGKTEVDGIKANFREWDIVDHEILAEIRGSFVEKSREGDTPDTITGVDARVYYQSYPGREVTINGVLVYSGGEPLIISYEDTDGIFSKGDNADMFPTISASGTIGVVGGATVWKSKWRVRVQQGMPYTLNRVRYGVVEDKVNKTVQDLTLAFVGAGSMAQGLGAMVINLKYGVLTENFAGDSSSSGGKLGVSTTHARLQGYGVSFGGSLTLPIKNGDVDKSGTQVQQHNQRASNGFLTAAVDEVLYGVDREDPSGEVGFIGVDTTLGLALPENTLGKLVKNSKGAQAVFTINTINNVYSMKFGVSLQVIECEGILSFKKVEMEGAEKLLPDTIFFAIDDGLRIPLSPPALYITGLGGGVSNLADTIGGDYVTELPPLTINLQMRLRMVQKLVGTLDASVSASQLSANGNFTLDHNDSIVQIKGGLSMRWVSPIYINVYGQVHILDDLIAGGASITIRADSFSGYLYAAIKIPRSVPLIGGKELARVEAGISDEFVGANVKVLGIKFGVIYYWGGDISFGTGINVGNMDSATGGDSQIKPKNVMLLNSYDEPGIAAIRDSVLVDGKEVDYTAIYGTNIQPLAVTPVEPRVSLYRSRSNEAPSTKAVNVKEITGQSLLLELPFTTEAEEPPKPSQVTLTGPNGPVPLIAADNEGGGNFLVQARADDNGNALDQTIYITVTDPDLVKTGEWTATLTGGELTDFRVSGVADLPELSSVSAKLEAGHEAPTVKVDYQLDRALASSGTMEFYLTQDPDVLTKLQSEDVKSDALGLSLGSVELERPADSGTHSVALPDTLNSGDYYVVATLSLPSGGMSAKRSEKLTVKNDKLPKAAERAALSYAGNGALALAVTDPAEADYDSYLVELLDETGAVIPGTAAIYDKDTAIRLDPVETVSGTAEKLVTLAAEAAEPRHILEAGKVYSAAVKTLRQTADGSFYFSDEAIRSAPFTLPEAQSPKLLKLDTTLSGGLNSSGGLEATLTFDQPVALDLLLDGQDQVADKGEFKETWTLSQTLEDGEHTLDFTAYSEQYDTLTAVQAEKLLRFTVDTAPPILEADSKTRKSVKDDQTTTGVSSQVVVARNGQFTFLGRTEPGVTLSANGRSVEAPIGADGRFTFTGTPDAYLADGALSGSVTLRAVDGAGNAATMPIYIMREELTSLTGLSLTAEGMDAGSGEKVIHLTVGQQTALTAQLLPGDGQPFPVDAGMVEWNVLSNLGLISLDKGVVTARGAGEALVKAAFVTGSTTAEDGTAQTLALEDVARVVISPARFDAETSFEPGVSHAKGYTRFEIIPETGLPFGELTLTDPRDEAIIIPMYYDSERKRYVCAVEGEYTTQTLMKNLKKNGQLVTILVRGDANGDGLVDETDARVIMEYYLSGGKPTDANAFLRLDWNGDWQLSALDAQRNLLYRYTMIETGGGE